MPTRLVHLVIDAADPPRLARFWAAALGWDVASDESGEVGVVPSGYDYPDPVALPLVLVPVSGPKTGKNRVHGVGPYLELLRVPGAKAVKNRMHLDVAPGPADDHLAEVVRLRESGAVEVDVGQGDAAWVVLADPEGNEFCVLTPR
jgi:hypothetical protein